LVRIVVAIDPAVSTGEDADETGIIVAHVADLAHDLAGAVGVDEVPDLPRDCGIEPR
jgi:phage terminase large subunit-like protein